MRIVIVFGAAVLSACSAIAPSACPAAGDLSPMHLVGTWQAQVEGTAAPVTLHLAKHPEFAGTVRGGLERGGRLVELAGDVDDGDLTLEESADGTHISATWLGEAVDGSCGHEFRGTWKAEGTPVGRPFVMKKQP